MVTGCLNGGTLWAGAQGNDRFGCRNALILSPLQEGMLPLSDGLIAPANRQAAWATEVTQKHRPPLRHTHTIKAL